ncbi:class I glutamine amidotransferase-like protein [Fusarium oxysporum f. sp. albedinis]|nr:class I glutamine amidotransferase-like protein [Fusarium oxysporum f. sp. albedinis]KAJ0128576.1 hypothetical protein HZ326_28329 [Fusarium oxysporum f. sp. albedinis]KAK2469833.1 hypothetical protein H9L39_18648 [Fusarium oxysporum f. sp. albedinis]
MPETLNLSKPQRTIHVGVILVDSTIEVLDVAPVDTLAGMTAHFVRQFPPHLVPEDLQAQALPFEFHWVSSTGNAELRSLTGGISVRPTDSYKTCPPLDIVLMGANEVGYQPTEADLAYIRKSYEQCSAFITICGGFQIPMQAGLFEGKTVTGPRPLLGELRQMSPGVKWVEKRWARDGKLWTSGSLTNGLDLMHAFTHHYWGGENTLVDRLAKIGAWPSRDVDYEDVAWAW